MKPVPAQPFTPERQQELDEMARLTAQLVAESSKLIAEAKMLLEEMRQLRTAREVLLQQRRRAQRAARS